jgi:Tol biopolymer transport system component
MDRPMVPSPRKKAGRGIAILLLVALVLCAAPTSGATGVAPDEPSGVLAFHADPSGDSGLYLMNADGTDVRLASRNIAGHPFSTWSPDGRYLAFLSGSFGVGAVRILDVPVMVEREVVRGPVRGYDWSPNGKRMVYESASGVLWTVGIAGGRPTRLVEGSSPDWSPDGKWIAFDRRGADIYKVSVRTSKVVRITRRQGPAYGPRWSPRGSLLAFVSERRGNSDLVVVRADGSKLRRLTHGRTPDEDFDWAPDGSRLVYVSYENGADPHSIGIGNAEVRTIDVGTGHMVDVSKDPRWDGDPAWSPDGNWIAFTHRTNHGEIEVASPDGSRRQLLQGAVGPQFNDCCPSWQPQP